MSDISSELDTAIPPHQLLDNTAAKHKTDLVHRGTLATRHKPTGEGLKCQILRRQHFLSKDNSPAPSSETPPPPPAPLAAPLPPPPPPAPPPAPAVSDNVSQEKTVIKPAKLSLIADLQSAQKTRRREETEAGPECDKESRTDTEAETVRPSDEDVNKKNLKKVPFLVELENSKNKAKLRSNKSKTVAPPKNMEIGIQDQLRLKLEARKKLVDEADEERELE